ncbi:MAG: hypothetical protein A3F33_00025 [Candidatus Woykebacteria bacterium RIFCSPHIGHO2_12_FULL_43_10]|uniref:UTP--glucose-1-phosphate uridylyltransferase n=1 Tax=Candidatus Woykebacteria bacterium RIFCSPHIGHO2_02_FULL_43_16b TaxID=1802601 RepID=A0A1G1WMI9_9BACT|nr:MAG: hypothetical protein A2802_00045 [Candidatus Woykebacteria bacterium RIFCSPHIGHO2_01_FULL_43_29]OGY28909.1 MAG: hypothetical protein A3J50_03715 [Candidatus Woykebacteria bacterium RIFCSPHIGHO2_02_FULL_43_16b]OGY30125.1 MAG: hypothetical protein A3F33_00025 [Candidatus Woykebacteria bacterium RIFCSPHIGHO2_12_FULL_43_10]
MKIRKAIIPAAGFGTRFLPATKAMPKEMLPVIDKPIIQYVVEDAVSAGIEDIIIVTGWHKRSIEDHFDYPYELERRLMESGKEKELEEIRRISSLANFTYIRQKGPMGTATPIWNCKHLIGEEPFLVLWGDEFVDATPTRCKQVVDAYMELKGLIFPAIRSDKEEDTKKYGYASGKMVNEHLMKVEKFVEKPGPGNAPSDLYTVSGYVFPPEMLSAAEEIVKRTEREGSKTEALFIDAVNLLINQGFNAFAVELKNAVHHDCGNKLQYLKAVIEYGLKHEEFNTELREYLKKVV